MFHMNHEDDKPVLALAKQKTTHKYNASTIKFSIDNRFKRKS